MSHSTVIRIRVTEGLRERCLAAAYGAGTDLSKWAREALEEAAASSDQAMDTPTLAGAPVDLLPARPANHHERCRCRRCLAADAA